MTTSFPTTSSAETAPAANATAPAALSGDLAALLGGTTPETPAATATAASPATDFVALLGDESAAPVAAPQTPAVSPVSPPVANPAAATAAAASATASGARAIAVSTGTRGSPSPTRVAPTDSRGFARSVSVTSASEATDEQVPETPASAPATMPDRATLEAIAALLAPVAALVAPPPAETPLALNAPSTNEDSEDESDGEAALAGAVSAAIPARRGEAVTLTVTLPERAVPALVSNATDAKVVATEDYTPAVATPSLNNEAPIFPAAASGPIVAPTTVSLPGVALAPSLATQSRAEPTPTSVAAEPAQAPMQVEASVELPDGAVIALALPTASTSEGAVETKSSPASAPVAAHTEKSAASNRAAPEVDFGMKRAAGKNFLTTEEQGVSLPEKKAGIAVAQTRPTMLFVPHDTLSAVSPTAPAIVSVVPAPTQVVAAGSPEPMPQLVAASFAKRAVETVTNVVDAQAASKLQPVPSVQLKFKFGTEDLAVRVALRNGAVHTEFRTDSPELRAAITNEWKAVTAEPESALRFLAPVVAPATASQNGTGSFAQQQQQQNQQQARAAQEFFGSIARSTPFQPRDGGAATSAAPVVLPTSVHLSAVA
ncbi:MAG: hypothetical protein KF715_20060 [Candidatus Didemnitutus sp.]|nr:hypothetical protein [Candidatus Didemnitutus sp.]